MIHQVFLRMNQGYGNHGCDMATVCRSAKVAEPLCVTDTLSLTGFDHAESVTDLGFAQDQFRRDKSLIAEG